MTINITIIVQIIHFIIAYFIITKLIIKPAFRIIQSDKLQEKSILDRIDSIKLENSKKEKQLKELKNVALNEFKKNKPDLVNQSIKSNIETPKENEIDSNEIEELSKTLVDSIINKIKYVK